MLLKSESIKNKVVKNRPLTFVELLKELNEVRAVPVKVRGQTVWCRTDISGNAAEVFKASGAKIPSKILKQKNLLTQNKMFRIKLLN